MKKKSKQPSTKVKKGSHVKVEAHRDISRWECRGFTGKIVHLMTSSKLCHAVQFDQVMNLPEPRPSDFTFQGNTAVSVDRATEFIEEVVERTPPRKDLEAVGPLTV